MLSVATDSFLLDPFSEVRRLQSQMNRLLEGFGSSVSATASHPPINLYTRDDAALVTSEIPGLAPGDIELTVRDDVLTLSGSMARDDDEEGVGWHRRERRRARFTRTIELPFRVDPERTEARFEDGVLEIELQRPEADRPKRITVNA